MNCTAPSHVLDQNSDRLEGAVQHGTLTKGPDRDGVELDGFDVAVAPRGHEGRGVADSS